jgi:hypothetical protein
MREILPIESVFNERAARVVPRPPANLLPPAALPYQWHHNREVDWLVEQYILRNGFRFEYHREMQVIRVPASPTTKESTLIFQPALALNGRHNSMMVDRDPLDILREYWLNAWHLNKKAPALPRRLKICYITNILSADQVKNISGSHWFAVIFDFSAFNEEALEYFNNLIHKDASGELTLPAAVLDDQHRNVRELFLKQLPFHRLYDSAAVSILDSGRSVPPLMPFYIAEVCKTLQATYREIPVDKQGDLYTCGDHAPRNAVTFMLYGCLPDTVLNIRGNFSRWRNQEAEWGQSLAILYGYKYRLKYMQPDCQELRTAAREACVEIIDQYRQRIERGNSEWRIAGYTFTKNMSLDPLASRRTQKIEALAALRAAIRGDLIINAEIMRGIEEACPKMYACARGKVSFMREIVNLLMEIEALAAPTKDRLLSL